MLATQAAMRSVFEKKACRIAAQAFFVVMTPPLDADVGAF